MCEDETGMDMSKGMAVQEYLLEFSKIYKEINNKFIDINYFLGICNIELNKYEVGIINFQMCNYYDNKFGDGYYYKGIAYKFRRKYRLILFKDEYSCH